MQHPVPVIVPTWQEMALEMALHAAHYLPDVQRRVVQAAYRVVPDPCNVLAVDTFTLKELQDTHEAVLGEKVLRDAFRRGMLRTGLLEDTGLKTKGVVGKPARLFRKVGG